MNDTDFFDDDLMQRRNPARSSPVQARESGSGASYDEIPVRPISDLNLTRMARHREEVNTRVASTVKTMEQYRRRQAELEREKQALEELSRKQDDYERGRGEMRDRLNESIVSLEKQETRATRALEIYSATRKRFNELLAEVDGINDDSWTDENFRDELNKAVAKIETVRQEYNTAVTNVETTGGERMPLIENSLAVAGQRTSVAAPGDFMAWLKIGFAITLPLGVLILLVGLVVLIFGHGR